MTDNYINENMFPDMGTPDNPMSELEEWFWAYHAENPQIYDYVDRFSRELAEKGRDTYSMTMVMGRIRWHTTVEAQGDLFKINDHAGPYYARLWMRNNPEQKGLFRTRKLIGGYSIPPNKVMEEYFENQLKMMKVGDVSLALKGDFS